MMHTTRSNSASNASKIAAAANGGGTYMTEALAFVSAFASATELKTGSPKCSVPPFFGVTPPTYLKKGLKRKERKKQITTFPLEIITKNK